MATYAPSAVMAAQAAGMSIEDYLAKRSGALSSAADARGEIYTPSASASGLSTSMPAAPTLPTMQLPNMAMPNMPSLQPVAKMPTMTDAEIAEARRKARATIADRAGRESTFLTTTTRSAAAPMTMAQTASPFAAKTQG